MAICKEIDAIRPELLGTSGDVRGGGSSRRRFPGVDGLRGTAILAVLVCHYSSLLPRTHDWVGVLENGWAGVDLFFVISGFLITGILIDAKGTRNYFRNFYARRVLRIFPLYYGFLAVLALVLLALKFAGGGSMHAGDAELADGRRHLQTAMPWLWSYTANVWIAKQKLWSAWSEIVIPLWSLSVEEQFYVVWPVVVFCFSRRALIWICIGVMFAALIARLALTASGTGFFAIYTLTPTRADSLAAGALLALLMRGPDGQHIVRGLAKYAGIIAGLLVLIVSPGFNPVAHPWLRNVLYSALAVFFAAILFCSIDSASFLGIPKRFYELRALRAIGGYSYGIYIFHLPLMYLISFATARWGLYDPRGNHWMPALAMIALNAAATSFVAFASFHLYEKQFLKLKRYFPENSSRPEMGDRPLS